MSDDCGTKRLQPSGSSGFTGMLARSFEISYTPPSFVTKERVFVTPSYEGWNVSECMSKWATGAMSRGSWFQNPSQ